MVGGLGKKQLMTAEMGGRQEGERGTETDRWRDSQRHTHTHTHTHTVNLLSYGIFCISVQVTVSNNWLIFSFISINTSLWYLKYVASWSHEGWGRNGGCQVQ